LSLKEINPGDAGRVRDTLRSVPLIGSYWVQPTADQKSSKDLPWYLCL